MDKKASGQALAKEQADKKQEKPAPKDKSGKQLTGKDNAADNTKDIKNKLEATDKNVEKSHETKSSETDKKEGDKLVDKKSTDKSGDKKTAKKQGDKKNGEKQSNKKGGNKQTDKKKAEKTTEPETAEIVMDDVDSDEEPQSYNKLKFHSSKMDLGLRILRDEMAHLQDSGNSLSRQIASMYRTFREMKDTDDINEDQECSDYDQYSNEDSQCGDYRDDDLDTEDDVNKMSDLETDSSARSLIESKRKRQQKRPPPIQLQDEQRQLQSGGSEKDPNGNPINPGGFSLPVDSEDDRDQGANSDFYPDFETSSSDDCSHCLCCSSLASYSTGSGMPWKYVDKSASSAPEYDSDSSEYYSDSDDGPLASPMPIYKRLSPFFYQECYAEVEDEGQNPDGEKIHKTCAVNKHDKDDEESVPEKRMSPLGCESPRPASSRASSGPELDEPDVNDNKIKPKDKRAKESKTKTASERNKESKKNATKKPPTPKSEPLVDSKVPLDKGKAAKVKRNAKEEPKSEPINASKQKDKMVSTAATGDDDEEEEPEEPVNVKDRIKNFEVHNKSNKAGAFKKNLKSKSPQDQEGEEDEVIDKAKQAVLSELRGAIKDSSGKPKVKPSPKPPPVKSKPQKLPKARNSDKQKAQSTFEMEIADDGGAHRKKQECHKAKRLAGQTIEIPVQYLNNRIPTPQGGEVGYAQPDELTFQVRPVHGKMQGTGPFIISSSPTVKRKVSKQVVRLKQQDDDISENTLRPEPQGGLQTPTPESAPAAGEHHMCPHCHKKAVPPEERKRSVQVLQLQPVDETQLPVPPTPVTPTPQTTITFEAPPPQQVVRPGRIIKVIPSGRQQMFMQTQPSEEPRSVQFRLNMPVGGQTHGVPIQVGDYIRIPLNRTQARGVRVIFN